MCTRDRDETNETERGFSLSALWSYLYGMGALSPKTCEILFEKKDPRSFSYQISKYLSCTHLLSVLIELVLTATNYYQLHSPKEGSLYHE